MSEAARKTIVITGASDGIGAAAARRLSRHGHEVVLVGRSPEKTAAVAGELGARFHVADFSRLDEVRALADALLAENPRIDVLANNAGGVMGRRAETEDGFELTFQVNHLAPFLLTALLRERLIASRATVINTSSAAARLFAKWDPEDLQARSAYSANAAYGNAKLANILFTVELQRRYGQDGLSAVAFHPGMVATNFSAGSNSFFRMLYRTPLRRFLLIGADEGAEQLLWLAEGVAGEDWHPGAYYEKFVVTKTNPVAGDPTAARELWRRSEELLGLG